MIGPDDPRLTAFLTDEVDAKTAAAIEKALAESEDLREEAAATNEAARLLAAALSQEVAPELGPEERQAIRERALISGSRTTLSRLGPGLAAAAVLVLGAGLLFWWPRRPPAPPEAVVADRAAGPVASPPSVAAVPAGEPASGRSPGAPTILRPSVAPSPVTLRGMIKDQSGAAIPGVSLTVTSVDSGATRSVQSDAQGAFALGALPPGRLSVRAELPGFSSAEYQVAAPPGALVSWHPTLRVSAMTETVTVTAEAPVVVTSSAAVESSVSNAPATVSRETFERLRSLGYVGSTRFDSEAYAYRADSRFVDVKAQPLSTFALDVDTASYSNVRRFLLDEGRLPPADAVRIEEMVNYFPYAYPSPRGGERFAAHLEMAPAPWKPAHRLVRVGLKTSPIDLGDRPPANLVFLVDVSGSMQEPNKLPLVRRSLRMLVEQLTARDHVAIVVYAGAAGQVLSPTPGDEKAAILAAIDELEAGGSTNGGAGLRLAYDLARRHYRPGGVNRVVLATDGDFNVGVTDEGGLVRLVQEKARLGVFLSVLGFGMGNLKDSTLEALSDKGNGNYAYIDTLQEAKKALVEQMAGTLVTVAKDVKVQVEFNPARVSAYRLIGYENRLLQPEDFADDAKDAGEVGAGHTVTALYEVVAVGASRPRAGTVDPLRYQTAPSLSEAAASQELLRIKLRYQEPQGGTSRLQEWILQDRKAALSEASADFRFAAAVAAFGMMLRESPEKGDASFPMVLQLATEARGDDASGYRTEFVQLVEKAQELRRDDARSDRRRQERRPEP